MLDQFIRFLYARIIGRIIGIGNFTVGIISFIVQTAFSLFHNLVFCAKQSLFLMELHMALATPLPLVRRLPLAAALMLVWRTIVGLLLAKLGYLCINELQQAVAPFLTGSGGMEGSWNPLPDPSGANSIIPTIAPGEGEPPSAPAESNSSTWSGSWIARWFNPSEGASAEATSQPREVPDQAQPAPQQVVPQISPTGPADPAENQQPDPAENQRVGGDTLDNIRRRRMQKEGVNPTYEAIQIALYDSNDLFEVKRDIINQMAALDPEGGWLERGARALVNRRTSTGEESLERLYEMLENLLQGGVQSEAFRSLRQKVREL